MKKKKVDKLKCPFCQKDEPSLPYSNGVCWAPICPGCQKKGQKTRYFFYWELVQEQPVLMALIFGEIDPQKAAAYWWVLGVKREIREVDFAFPPQRMIFVRLANKDQYEDLVHAALEEGEV